MSPAQHSNLNPVRMLEAANRWRPVRGDCIMIVLGIVLLVIGFIAAVHIIWILGIIALVVGAVFAIAGFAGHEIGGRKHIY